MRCLLPLAILLAVVGLYPSLLIAQDGPKQYRALIGSALEEYDLGNYEEALSLFERAHRIEPSARTLRGMGLASYQARKYVIALAYLEAALDDQRKPLTPQFRRDVETALEATRGFIVSFELVIAPANASVTVDGEPVHANSGRTLLLDPGEHEVVATAPGYKTDSRRIKATSGRPGRIELRLLSEQGQALVPPPADDGNEPPSQPAAAGPKPAVPTRIKVLTLTGLSFAVLGGALGAGAGIKTLSEENELAAQCPDKECGSEQSEQLESAKRWGTISTVSLAVGGAGLAAGLVGLVLWARHKKSGGDAPRASARLTPLLFMAGAGVQGRF
jgi:hypothetical protein